MIGILITILGMIGFFAICGGCFWLLFKIAEWEDQEDRAQAYTPPNKKCIDCEHHYTEDVKESESYDGDTHRVYHKCKVKHCIKEK
jgi:hypothetical protein